MFKQDRDTDENYKRHWRRSDCGPAAMDESLRLVKDRRWVVAECVRQVGPTAEATSALISHGLAESDRKTEDDPDAYFRTKRLRLLQYQDRLKTYLAVNMGRFSAKEYRIFRAASLEKVAIRFAEAGKTGAIGMLVKWHFYSLAPVLFSILDAIPETLSPRKYDQLLPGRAAVEALLPRRARDWSESEDMVLQLEVDDEVPLSECTEYLVEKFRGLRWPTGEQIESWYLRRARTIDQLSGQLENSLALLDIGLQKGFEGLRPLLEDATDLHRVSFLDAEATGEENLSLSQWESLGAYDKFKVFLRGVNEETVVDRLLEVALPFMRKQAGYHRDKFLARFVKELSAEGSFRTCAAVIEQGCKEFYRGLLFDDDADTVSAALSCVYASPETNQWDLMASVLSKLPWKEIGEQVAEDGVNTARRGFVSALRYGNRTDFTFPRPPPEAYSRRKAWVSEDLERSIVQAESHVQAGQILSQYQVPTAMGFFLQRDVNGTKQIFRLLLSKFSRWQPSRTEVEWVVLWKDLQTLQEKAFPFLERDYVLFEFCRGLLKAGKFALARSYFESNSAMNGEKVENLVIQIAREYFYSASSLESYDVERAKDCLSLLPTSKAAKAELDVIVALTEKLPNLGVYLLPAQFRQIKDHLEVVKMAIYTRKGSYVPVDQLLEVARLLGFSKSEEMAGVEEAIAREVAAYGDIELAQELCLGLARKGHGKIWDLCAAIGRGPETGSLDVKSRKELLGFSLKHCDEDSIGELLGAWKEYDLMDQCADLAAKAGLPVVQPSTVDSFSSVIAREEVDTKKFEAGQRALESVTYQQIPSSQDGYDPSGKAKKLMAFSCLQLPWLLQLHSDPRHRNLSSKATALIIYGLGIYGIAPRDELLLRLARSALDAVDGYLVACGYLASLRDSQLGAEFLTDELNRRKGRDEQHRILKAATLFSSLQERLSPSSGPEERRELILGAMRGEAAGVTGEDVGFWTEYKEKVQEKLQLLEQTKSLTTMMPDIEMDRLFGGDLQYVNEAISTRILSMTLDKLSTVEELTVMLDELHTVLPEDASSNFSLKPIHEAFVLRVMESVNCKYCEDASTSPGEETSPFSFLDARYCICKKYFTFISPAGLRNVLDIIFRSSLSFAQAHHRDVNGLSYLCKFWIEVLGDTSQFFEPNSLSGATEVCSLLLELIQDGLLTQSQGWKLVSDVVSTGVFTIRSREILKCSILVGCSTEAALKVAGYMSEDGRSPDLEDITNIYLEVLDDSLGQLKGSGNLQLVTNLLTAAGLQSNEVSSQIQGANVDFLEKLQQSVRCRLSSLSDQADLPAEARISLLELTRKLGNPDQQADRLRDLVVLKSREVLKEFHGYPITAADLSTPESASNIFTQLAEQSSSRSEAVALKTLLETWDVLFQDVDDNREVPPRNSDEYEDDWGEGWQDFDADLKGVALVHKLHSCWKLAFLKLIQHQGLEVLLKVLDQSAFSSKSTLLTEEEATELVELTSRENPLSALKLTLLLSFEKTRSATLSMVEDQLRQTAMSLDSATVALILSAGRVSSLAADPRFSCLFTALCQFMGNLTYRTRAGLLLPDDSFGLASLHIVFPYFIAELTRTRHYGIAGSLVLQHMKTPFFFATWNSSAYALQHYLQTQQSRFQQLIGNYESSSLHESSLSYLSETLSRMVSHFPTYVAEALDLLSRDML